MPAVRERQRFDAEHGRKRQIAIKMRKQRAAARSLPFQRQTEPVRIHMHKQKASHAGEMFRRGLSNLSGG